MTKTVKLIRPLAGYRLWQYTFCEKNDYYHLDNPTPINVNACIHKDIVQWMPTYFEEVEENKDYFYIGLDWSVNPMSTAYNRTASIKEYGNYYDCSYKARCVSNLRKHVYKFPMCKKDEKGYTATDGFDWWWIDMLFELSTYSPMCIHHSSTEEDRAERLRLIENCIKGVGYLTI